MNTTMKDASKAAKTAIREIQSRLREEGYDETEVEEVCIAAQCKIEERLAASDDKVDFSDIIRDFASPEFPPERSAQTQSTNTLGLIALLFSLLLVMLFATVPFVVSDGYGGAAMLTLAMIASPVGIVLGWIARHQRFGKIALGISILPIIGLCLSVGMYLLE